MRVSRIMTTPVITVRESTPLDEAARTMLDRGIGSLVVVGPDQTIRGILCESDYTAKETGIPFSAFSSPQVLGCWIGHEGLERAYREAAHRTVRGIMSHPIYTVAPDAHLEEVLELMLERGVRHVPVVENGKPVGIVTPHDLLRLMRDELMAGAR
jgi:CBS domain-containing protein